MMHGNKEKNMLPILEIVNEMHERGIDFLPVDLYKSDAKHFLPEEDGIRLPLSKLNGFGEVDANKLVKVREEVGKFEFVEDIKNKTGIGKVAMQVLEESGCLAGIPKSAQVSLFDSF